MNKTCYNFSPQAAAIAEKLGIGKSQYNRYIVGGYEHVDLQVNITTNVENIPIADNGNMEIPYSYFEQEGFYFLAIPGKEYRVALHIVQTALSQWEWDNQQQNACDAAGVRV